MGMCRGVADKRKRKEEEESGQAAQSTAAHSLNPLVPLSHILFHPLTPAAAYLACASRAPSRSYASNALTASAHSGAAGCLTQ
jgi:hypothetical protein